MEQSEIDADAAAEAEEPSPAPSAPGVSRQRPGRRVTQGPTVNVNTASYEELRSLGLSVTQTGRMLAFRERTGGFGSLEELEAIPGLPNELIGDLRHRLTLGS